jgi:hypothetical protein
VTVCGTEVPTARRGVAHGEAEAQEGQAGRRDINRDLAGYADSRADEGPEDDKWRWPAFLGFRLARPKVPRLGWGRPAAGEKRQEGMPAVTSCRGCAGGTNP